MSIRTPSHISVRRAHLSDNVLLSEIGAETFSDAFGPDNTRDDMEVYLRSSFSPKIQAAELADPLSLFLVAEVSGQPVGYARLLQGDPPPEVNGSRPIEIVRIYARTQWIGQGVGAALMQACLDESEGRGCDTIWLGVWEENERAIAFYRKWGFRQVGSHTFRLGDAIQTDFLLERSATPPGAA